MPEEKFLHEFRQHLIKSEKNKNIIDKHCRLNLIKNVDIYLQIETNSETEFEDKKKTFIEIVLLLLLQLECLFSVECFKCCLFALYSNTSESI